MKKLYVLLALVGVVSLLEACSQPTPQNAAAVKPVQEPSKGMIGLSVLTMTNPFFKEIADTITTEAAKHGYKVLAYSGDLDVAKQQNQIKDFIVQQVNAIVLTPCDSKSIGPAIQEANAAGIPVFTADIACLAPNAKIVAHVATDNYQGGRLACKALVEAIGGKGKVAIVDFPEIESVILRTTGFRDELAELKMKDPNITMEVVATLSGGCVRDISFKTTQDLLQSHPDINGIFAINDPSALGSVAALEQAGKAAQIQIVSFDGQPEGKQAILEGKIYAEPVQFPDKIGIETVNAIMKYFEGEEVPEEILIPTALYYKADAEKDPILQP